MAYQLNSTVNNGNLTANLTGNSTVQVTEEHTVIYALCVLVLISAVTLIGNCLVIAAVKKTPSLRSVTNYLIVSLAVADIMVGVLVMPLGVYVEVSLCVIRWA